MNTYKDLLVWQKSMDLVEKVYLITRKLPKSELFNLISQSERCAVSIPSNIAEGSKRNHIAEYIQFLSISNGSAAELETQLMVIKKLYPQLNAECDDLIEKTEEVLRMLYSLIASLRKK